MATVVMYCNIPEEGGATNFRNAGVHIQPEVGNAIFFSYMNPITKIMDTGFTEHSGCPVFEGEKKIVTQWIRYGVDDDNPWDSYNTLGVKYSEENDF
jgi:2OG-Fe(II) oxygenase superfamily